jgi:hypothetical protein
VGFPCIKTFVTWTFDFLLISKTFGSGHSNTALKVLYTYLAANLFRIFSINPMVNTKSILSINIRRSIGVMVRILGYCARGRGLDSRTVQTFVCMNIICLCWVWAFSMYSMYVFTKKRYISMYIYPLSRIHNTSLVSTNFGLDKRECVCLEYLFFI